MVHGTGTKRFKRVKLADGHSPSSGVKQSSARTQEPINPFLFAPDEFAQQRRRHGGNLIAPTQFVPLDSARRRQAATMKLRKKQLSRAATEAERNAEIAKAIAKAVRRERRTKAAVQNREDSDSGMSLGSECKTGVAVRHIVNVSDVIFASPEAAQLLCGEDIEWVDDEDSTALSAEERARLRRKDNLLYRTHTIRTRSMAHAHSARLKTAQKTRQ